MPPSRESSLQPRQRAEPRAAVLATAFRLLGTVGYRAITYDLLSKESGVGRPTLYRWWASKAEILLDAATADARQTLPAPDLGSLEADLGTYLETLFGLLNRGGAAVARSLVAEAALDPEFAAQFRERFVASRRIEVEVMLNRAAGRGELPPQDWGPLVDAFFGPVWYRMLLHEPLSSELVPGMVRRLLEGWKAP